MEKLQTVEAPEIQTVESPEKPFLFNYLEQLPVITTASVYTNLGVTLENGKYKQDSDDT